MNRKEVETALGAYRPWVPEPVWRGAVEAVAKAEPNEQRRELERVAALLDRAVRRVYAGAR